MSSRIYHPGRNLVQMRWISSLALAACFIATSACLADIAPRVASSAVVYPQAASCLPLDIWAVAATSTESVESVSLVAVRNSGWALGARTVSSFLSSETLSKVLESAAPAPAVHSLPPPPSSLSIALSGLATFGALRLARQAKNIHLGAIPEWYHAGAPDQVGSVVRLDLSADQSLVPVCWYEPILLPDVARIQSCSNLQPDDQPRWQSLYFISTTSPRSPPAVA